VAYVCNCQQTTAGCCSNSPGRSHTGCITVSDALVLQILRCVQKWRVNKVVVHLAGIELDRARQSGSTRNGDFRGIKVLDCPAGKGFICEEVNSWIFLLFRETVQFHTSARFVPHPLQRWLRPWRQTLHSINLVHVFLLTPGVPLPCLNDELRRRCWAKSVGAAGHGTSTGFASAARRRTSAYRCRRTRSSWPWTLTRRRTCCAVVCAGLISDIPALLVEHALRHLFKPFVSVLPTHTLLTPVRLLLAGRFPPPPCRPMQSHPCVVLPACFLS
jgi:hypothetical protein